MRPGAKPKYQCTVKVYGDDGTRLETQESRRFGLRAIYLSMTNAEKEQCRQDMDEIDAKEKSNG